MTIQCKECGKKFHPARVYAVYCSVKCRMRSYRRRLKAKRQSEPGAEGGQQ